MNPIIVIERDAQPHRQSSCAKALLELKKKRCTFYIAMLLFCRYFFTDVRYGDQSFMLVHYAGTVAYDVRLRGVGWGGLHVVHMSFLISIVVHALLHVL